MELPKGQGWYLKRGVIYLAIRVQREKFPFCTRWRLDDSTSRTASWKISGKRKSLKHRSC